MPDRAFRGRIDAVRAFNRFYTRRIGVLRRHFLESAFSLTQVRVLYELANRPRPTAAGLGRDLDLDPGYLSRILSGFERRGLLRRILSAVDRRQSFLALTPRGRSAFAPLNARSHTDVAAMLRRLSPEGQVRLVAAMRTIETLLDAGRPPTAAAVPGRARRFARSGRRRRRAARTRETAR
jgi:DNA-binding MarR family transcriptional regulator